VLAGLLEIPGPPVELAETEMAVGGERAQAQLLGEGQGLTIVRLRRIDLEALYGSRPLSSLSEASTVMR
jgi:hypothetical protein